MINDIDTFVRIVPTAAGAEWKAIGSFVEQSIDYYIGFCGVSLYEAIEQAAVDDAKARYLSQAIAFRAYGASIPFNDLLQTPTGFAVVSNSNQAPASRERVDKLMQWCKLWENKSVDELIRLIMADLTSLARWTQSSHFEYETATFFLIGADLAGYIGKPSTTREDLTALRSTILTLQESNVAEYISTDYLDELIDKQRLGSLTDLDRQVVEDARRIIGALIQADEKRAYRLIEKLVNRLNDNLSLYPTYYGSLEYRLKIARRYENKGRDRTFFFG